LPSEVRALADRGYALLKANATHVSLHVKKIGDLWSVRVGLHYRALVLSRTLFARQALTLGRDGPTVFSRTGPSGEAVGSEGGACK